LISQGQTKGPDPLSADEPARVVGPELTDEEKKDMVIRAYKKLKESFEEFAKPDGGKNTPAKTCRDLKAAHPDKDTGEYWIDPNGADPKDSIMVFCNMETLQTCVESKPGTSPEFSIANEVGEGWLSKKEDGPYNINYKADSNQLSFLQLLSGRAAQTITFHCKNTVAFRNPRGNTRSALSLMSWNDLEIKKGGKFKYEVVEDGCKERAKTWAKSVFTVDTSKPTRLPIVDIRVKDIGKARQAFKVEVGRVCFS